MEIIIYTKSSLFTYSIITYKIMINEITKGIKNEHEKWLIHLKRRTEVNKLKTLVARCAAVARRYKNYMQS